MQKLNKEEKALMTLLKAPPKQPRTTVVQLRLDEEARSTLTKYAEYLECSPSHVVAEALKLVYHKDKDFQTWLSRQHTDSWLRSRINSSCHPCRLQEAKRKAVRKTRHRRNMATPT